MLINSKTISVRKQTLQKNLTDVSNSFFQVREKYDSTLLELLRPRAALGGGGRVRLCSTSLVSRQRHLVAWCLGGLEHLRVGSGGSAVGLRR